MATSVQRYFQAGLAPATQKTYSTAMNRYKCYKCMITDPFPVSELLLCSFAAYLADEGRIVITYPQAGSGRDQPAPIAQHFEGRVWESLEAIGLLCRPQLPHWSCHDSRSCRVRGLHHPEDGSVEQLSVFDVYSHPEGPARFGSEGTN